MSTILSHMVWPWCEFRMQVWNVLHTARWKYRTKKWCNRACSLPWVVQLQKGWTDRDAVWCVDSGWSKEACIRRRCTLVQPGEYDWTFHVRRHASFLWPPCAIGQVAGHYIFAVVSFFLLFYSSSNLSGRRLNVYHTSTHGVALVCV